MAHAEHSPGACAQCAQRAWPWGLLGVLGAALAVALATANPQTVTDFAVYEAHAFRPHALVVDPATGDIDLPLLGLSPAQWQCLTRTAAPVAVFSFDGEPPAADQRVPCAVPCVLQRAAAAWPRADVVELVRDLPKPDPRRKPRGQRWVLSFRKERAYTAGVAGSEALWRGVDWTTGLGLTTDFPAPMCFLAPDAAGRGRRVRAKHPDVLLVAAVSNCGGRQDPFARHRTRFLRALMRLVPTHSYGRCAHNRDGPDRGAFPMNWVLFQRYKFAFVWENSVEADYVTEKLYNALAGEAIPVYYGAPNIRDHVPDGAFVDVRLYPEPRRLAAELRRIAGNATLYAAYHSWRLNSTVLLGQRFCRYHRHCRMCVQFAAERARSAAPCSPGADRANASAAGGH